MTLIHITTPETFMHGAIETDSVCAVCGHQAKIRYGYLDWHCSVCKLYVSPESFMGTVVYQMRRAMGLERKDFAAKLGIKPKSLSNAENCRCSTVIFNKSKALFHEFVKAKNLKSPHSATSTPETV